MNVSAHDQLGFLSSTTISNLCRQRIHPPSSISSQRNISCSTKMAGANYMGGRRNYAKARSKDTTAKAQRNHFGKQKILATSLSKPATLTANRCDLSSNPIARISLAHAQQDPSVRHAQKTHLRSAAFSVYSPPITPPQSKSNMFHDKSHFSGYSTYPLYAFPEDPKPPKRSSVILRDLDLSERTF